MKLSISAI